VRPIRTIVTKRIDGQSATLESSVCTSRDFAARSSRTLRVPSSTAFPYPVAYPARY
jgi:hypothetical protein